MSRLSARVLIASLVLAMLLPAMPPARAQSPSPASAATIALDVDAHDVTRGILHVHERIPVTPGPLTLAYPKWIPGEHMPAGPIVNASAPVIQAGAATLPWRRDLEDVFAVRVDVPAGTTALDVSFDFLGAAVGEYSSARLASLNMLALTWNKVLMVPQVPDYRTIVLAPTLHLPGADWDYATALDTASKNGATIVFAPVTMEQLVDSPVDAGTVSRRWPLGSIDGAPVDLAAFADTSDQLDVKPEMLKKLRNLVAEMGALYGARHFNHYTFLLTVSDQLPGEGVEHHQSSDDGVDGDFFTDDDSLLADADLLPHEFNHSWDGKFRRPAGLATANLHDPMHDDLLWVYEGMTEYYGDTQAARSGLRTTEQWRQRLAATYASLDVETGRLTRPLQDTADAAPELYAAPRAFASARRSVDFYPEGELMWLEADGIIRARSGGHKSLDDVARAFFGRTSTGPQVVTYAREDVVAALEAVQPYDWHAFLAKRIDAIAPHPPDPFTPAGWKLVYKPTRSAYERQVQSARHYFEASYSIGISGQNNGTIGDVIQGSPAALAGIGPGGKIVAVNDHAVKDSVRALLDAALVDAQKHGTPLRLLILQDGIYRTATIAYTGGPRYPDLERIPGTADTLSVVAAPRRVESKS